MISRSVLAFILAISCMTGRTARTDEVSESIDTLIRASRVYDERKMAAAAAKLARIGKDAAPALVAKFDDEDSNVRWRIALTLHGIGHASEEVRKVLLSACVDVDADVRCAGVLGLAQIFPKDHRTRPMIEARVRDPHDLVRAHAWIALWRTHRSSLATEALAKLLSSKDWMVTRAASDHLGEIGRPALTRVLEIARKPESSARAIALTTLGRIGIADARVISSLASALGSSDSGVANSAERSLGDLGKESVSSLVQLLASPKVSTRTRAIRALGRIGRPAGPARSQLAAIIENTSGSLQIEALRSLGRIGDLSEDHAQRITSLLRNDDRDTRATAVQVLLQNRVRAKHTLEELTRIAESDPIESIRRAAIRALRSATTAPEKARAGSQE